MRDEIVAKIQLLQARGIPISVICAGAGWQLIDWLHVVPGATRMMTECRILHSNPTVESLVGHAQKVSEDAAELYAKEAYALAMKGADTDGSEAIGIGITAALATTRERRGADRAFIAVLRTPKMSRRESTMAMMTKEMSREDQDELVSRIALDLLVKVAELE